MIKSTTMTAINKVDDPILTGKEFWPLLDSCITEIEYREIIKRMKGLNKYWNCLEKAMIVQDVIQRGLVITGSLMVVSGDLQSEYGFEFLPPYEFHAWVQLKNVIIDVSLPGVIEKGLNSVDDYGPYLVNRKPVVLAGVPEYWMKYKPYQIM